MYLTILLVLISVSCCSFTSALTIVKNDTLTLDGSLENDNYLILGGTIKLNDTFQKDLAVIGGEISSDSRVYEDAFFIGGDIHINEKIDEDLVVIGGNVFLNDDIDGDVIVLGGNIITSRDADIRGDLLVLGATAIVNSSVSGDVTVYAGDVIINDKVGGDAVLYSDYFVLGDDAMIAGDLSYHKTDKISFDKSKIGGVLIPLKQLERGYIDRIIEKLTWLLLYFIIGLALFLLLPTVSRNLTEKVERKLGISILVGFVGSIVMFFAFFLLLITIVGIPFSLVILGYYILAIFVCWPVVGMWLGRIILKRWFKQESPKTEIALLTGIIALGISSLIPGISGLVVALVYFTGLGAMILATRDYLRKEKQNRPGGRKGVSQHVKTNKREKNNSWKNNDYKGIRLTDPNKKD